MGMVTDIEAHQRGICVFCEQVIDDLNIQNYDRTIYQQTALCRPCFDDWDKNITKQQFMAVKMDTEEQLEFALGDSPEPIVCLGALSLGYLILYHPRALIGSHITCEEYGIGSKFIILPPTKEAGSLIMATMSASKDDRTRLKANYKSNGVNKENF